MKLNHSIYLCSGKHKPISATAKEMTNESCNTWKVIIKWNSFHSYNSVHGSETSEIISSIGNLGMG